MLLLLATIQTVFYMTMNHVQWFPTHKLPLTAIDEWIPFWPWTVIPYFVLLLGGVIPVLLARRNETIRRAILAYGICVAIVLPIFLFFPTLCRRPDLMTLPDRWDGQLFRWLAAMDSPACAFPSLHIVLPTICCWIALAERHRYAIPFCVAGVVLSASILTTKQHSIWDWCGGLLIACFALWLSGYIIRRRKNHSATASKTQATTSSQVPGTAS
ncbi:phosphatase PAP2 family protein [Thalassoroseus pseudoceratinae]|uniref:phosphatase PAP2 family protein n=1 Tax=Thalassoroseus pseudoceratinae TaxID=2713176 RepID=UPI00141F9274|nr:phosphatase PAP2 family protein [Thalassoroseus pseudoceratinae]